MPKSIELKAGQTFFSGSGHKREIVTVEEKQFGIKNSRYNVYFVGSRAKVVEYVNQHFFKRGKKIAKVH